MSKEELNIQDELELDDLIDEIEIDDIVDQVENPFEQENKKLIEEAEKYKDAALRVQAEFDNYRKRTAQDSINQKDKGISSTIKSILPVVDSVERAIDMYSKDETQKELLEGFEKINKQFLDVLTSIGVCKMDCLEQKFDPTLHEAMLEQPDDSKESGTILTVYTNGYTLNNNVVRHAQVIVAQ